MNIVHLRELIIQPTLYKMDMYSVAAENLLVGTACVESDCGRFIEQINGPGLGVYQCEPGTYLDIWRYVKRTDNHGLYKKMLEVSGFPFLPFHEILKYDIQWATIICRIKYWMQPEKLPDYKDIEGLGEYWKKYYNTEHGKGTADIFVKKYKKYNG